MKCIICRCLIQVRRRGAWNKNKTPICRKPDCKRKRKTILQQLRRNGGCIINTPQGLMPAKRLTKAELAGLPLKARRAATKVRDPHRLLEHRPRTAGRRGPVTRKPRG